MATETQDTHNSDRGGFLKGLIAGSVITGVAIYLAPRVAVTLRRCVTDATMGVGSAAAERFHDLTTCVAGAVDRAADVAEEVKKKGQAVRDEMADAVGRGAHEVGRGAREVARTAHDVEEFAMASKTDHAPTRA